MKHLFGPLRHLNLWETAAFETNGGGGGGGGGDDDNDPPPATVYENDYSDPNNPKLDTDPNTPGTQVSTVGHSTDNDNDSSSQTIQSGDSVSQLAEDNNTTIGQIKADNPGIDINNIKAGETINITSNTRNEGESIYTGATQAELNAGNAMGSNDDDPAPVVSAVTADDVAVADPEQQGTRSDAVDDILVATHGWTMGADGDAYPTPEAAEAAGSTYDDLDGALTTIPAAGITTSSDITTSSGGANTATEALLDLTAGMASGDVGVDEATATLNLITGNDLTADDIAALMPPAETTTSTGGYDDLDGALTNPTGTTAVDFTEIDDGGGTDFSVVSGDNRDDLSFDLSDPAERLVTGNGLGFTGTYGGVTYTNGYEDKEPLQIEITPGDDIGASIEDALGTDTTETDETILSGYAGMSQNDFLNAAGSDVRIVEVTSALKEGSDLTLGEIAAGLGYDTVGGFMEELSLRAKGTGTMADDALNLLVEANMLRGSETYLNPEYAENLKNIGRDERALDRFSTWRTKQRL